MKKVYVSAQLPTLALDKLQQNHLAVAVYQGEGLITRAELLAQVRDVDFLITTLSTEVDEAIIDAAPQLKLIANFGAGFNNIDVDYARSKGILVSNTPQVSTNSVTELTIGLILALSHRIVEGDHQMRASGFPGWAPLYFLGHEISGKALGIVGLGNIGREIAKKATALGMHVSYFSPRRISAADENALEVNYKSFADLIQTSDYISINAPLTPQTHHQFDAAVFAQMKSTAALINVGRGPIVDETALLQALKNHQIGGAALDVYENEPEFDAGFKTLKNVILTPHIGNATVEARDAMAAIVANNVILMNQDEQPKFVVDR
ncbi:2-hydroxyacid dehydrogenase family protein [Lapidilactobacillus luobeiensis]|uniref:2-hydroxyacid dehydrogenase family protein n=1 Tax=Lapidilactobacillus luobeiensis TaxID=2950371 RepID=UPI0021C2637F|nr:2-hydroxyacid dehydrogenase family protein [Lapidilactobacillus luobeiensis]